MRFKNFLYIIIVAVLSAACGNDGSDATHPVVRTNRGLVRGYVQDSVAVFKGIPYAVAGRFERPVAPRVWDTIADCTEYGPIAMQSDIFPPSDYNPVDTVYTMSEDCLNLNIWTSMRRDDGKRPVMVWIHGGGFENGSSHSNVTTDGFKMADRENVVMVSLNHRLGVLGFLNLADFGKKYESSANLGMMDIVAALWWIKDNIAAFGGDPGNITIFGQGSGGAKVTTVMSMPMAKGLFHKAIVQSGVMQGMEQEDEISRLVGRLTVEEAGTEDADGLLELPFDSLQAAARRAIARASEMYPRDILHKIRLSPTVGTRVLPYSLFSDSAMMIMANVPVILGSTLSEVPGPNKRADELLNRRKGLKRLSSDELYGLLHERYADKTDAAIEAFKKNYPTRPLYELYGLGSKQRSLVMRMAHFLAERGDAPVYVYMFNWQSPLNEGEVLSFRGSDVPFVFNNYELAPFSAAGGDEARRLSRIMSRCWAYFARSGNPNNSSAPFWRRINVGEGHTMIFDRDTYLDAYPDIDLMRVLEPENVKDIKLVSDDL